MAFNIPRLQQDIPLAEKDGKPSYPFHRWWDSAASAIESNFKLQQETIDTLNDTVERLDAAVILLDDTVEELNTTVTRVDNAVTLLDATVDELEITVQRVDDAVALLDETVSTLNDTVVTLDTTVDQLDDLVNNLIDYLVAAGLIDNAGVLTTNRVNTNSIVVDSITERYSAQNLSDIVLPTGIETEVLSLSVSKTLTNSEVDIDVALRLESTDDIVGTINVYRDSTLITTFDPYLKGPGSTYRTVFTLPFTEFNIPSGNYVYSVKFIKDSGATTLKALANSNIRLKEIKR